MKPARVLFRADASHAIGFGHVARVTALIEELAVHGGQPILLFGGDLVTVGAWTRERGLHAEVQDWSPEQVARVAEEQQVRAVVIDGRPLADMLVPELARRSIRSVLVDDNGHCALPVSTVVNHNFHAPALAETYPNAPQRLLGRRYLMLRQDILRLGHGACRPTRAKRLRVVITFGGSDPVDATSRITRLVPGDRPLELVVVVGPGYRGDAGLAESIHAAEARGHRVELHRSPADPGRLFATADAAICSAGGTLGELAYLGCPALAYAIVADQVAPARQQASDGLVAGGRRWSELADEAIAAELAAFVADDARRDHHRERALATADGAGPGRILDEAL